MKKIRFLLIITILIGVNTLSGQKRLVKKADYHYDNLAYVDAISLYNRVVDNGRADSLIHKKLGDSYYYNSDLKNALKSYKKFFELKKDLHPDYLARISSALKNSDDYETADELLRELYQLNTKDLRGLKLKEQPNYLKEIEANSGRYSMRNVAINSERVDYAPAFYKDELVFSSARGFDFSSKTKDKWTEHYYLTLHKASIMGDGQLWQPDVFSKKLNAQLHESTASFSKDGNTVYFTRNNIEGVGFKSDNTGHVRLKIFRARKSTNGNWTNIEELPFNSDEYSVAHPSLSDDEKTLYFASDMPSTFGMSDLYKVEIMPDGSFGVPVNLGPKINTENRETFPFVTKSGKLYFSSDGHLGLGGLDIFATGEDLDHKIINVGKPVNSEADDITFIINEDSRKGYFASNREGGKGEDDLYAIEELEPLKVPCLNSIQIKVIDEKTNEPIQNSLVELKNADGSLYSSQKTDEHGMINSSFECVNLDYKVMAKATDYEDKEASLTASADENEYVLEMKLHRIKPEIGDDLFDILRIKPVYYNLDGTKAILDKNLELDKVVAYLEKYPNVIIKVISHADSRGTKAYNTRLTIDRSALTADYLIRNGVAKNRLILAGMGESQIKNHCVDGVYCSEEEHFVNRRTEFIVIKM